MPLSHFAVFLCLAEKNCPGNGGKAVDGAEFVMEEKKEKVKKKGDKKSETMVMMRTENIRYTHGSICKFFHDGRRVEDTSRNFDLQNIDTI